MKHFADPVTPFFIVCGFGRRPLQHPEKRPAFAGRRTIAKGHDHWQVFLLADG